MASLRSPACRRLLHGLAQITPVRGRYFGRSGAPLPLGGGTPSLFGGRDRWPQQWSSSHPRSLSTGGSGGGGKDDDDTKSNRVDDSSDGNDSNNDDDDDPFGVSYRDGESNLGPKPPPSFRRDAATGKFTGEIEAEITDEERKLLSLTEIERGRVLADRFVAGWNDDGDGGTGGEGTSSSSRQASEVAARIRNEEMAFNTLGRRVADVAETMSNKGGANDGADEYVDPEGVSAPLSASEFATFRAYLRKEHGITDVTAEDDEIPVARSASASTTGGRSRGPIDADPDLDLTWLTAAARAEVEGGAADDDPFVDLMPSDLNPARKVNRRRAKPLPKSLLHHNNLSLLRRYVTPGGQIMNRVQSRLGAKDQRKIAKLVKRARHLGLMPYLGQWKLEDHGNVREADIGVDREWEKDLVRRGLVKRERWRED